MEFTYVPSASTLKFWKREIKSVLPKNCSIISETNDYLRCNMDGCDWFFDIECRRCTSRFTSTDNNGYIVSDPRFNDTLYYGIDVLVPDTNVLLAELHKVIKENLKLNQLKINIV